MRVRPYIGTDNFIFVSYSHRDMAEVFELVDRLQKHGYNVWFDEGIDPGTEWDEMIARHIRDCSYFIGFITENYIKSQNCRDELNFARDLDKDRLLIYGEEVDLPIGMQMRMNRLQAIFKYKYQNPEDFYEKVFCASGIETCKSKEVEAADEDDKPEERIALEAAETPKDVKQPAIAEEPEMDEEPSAFEEDGKIRGPRGKNTFVIMDAEDQKDPNKKDHDAVIESFIADAPEPETSQAARSAILYADIEDFIVPERATVTPEANVGIRSSARQADRQKMKDIILVLGIVALLFCGSLISVKNILDNSVDDNSVAENSVDDNSVAENSVEDNSVSVSVEGITISIPSDWSHKAGGYKKDSWEWNDATILSNDKAEIIISNSYNVQYMEERIECDGSALNARDCVEKAMSDARGMADCEKGEVDIVGAPCYFLYYQDYNADGNGVADLSV